MFKHIAKKVALITVATYTAGRLGAFGILNVNIVDNSTDTSEEPGNLIMEQELTHHRKLFYDELSYGADDVVTRTWRPMNIIHTKESISGGPSLF